MDAYQPIYDAVRSRISGGNFEQAVRDAMPDMSHAVACVSQEWQIAASEHQRPSVLFKPSLTMDGNEWCALFGENLQDGVAGFGKSPDEAMRAFDQEWYKKAA